MSKTEDLRQLKELLDEGVVTQEEFEAQKSALLNSPQPWQGQNEVGAAQTGKNRIAAGILALFFGWLGIHKFYLGYTLEGGIMLGVSVLMMVISFCAAGLGGIFFAGLGSIAMGVIGVIEGIMYLTKTDQQFEAIYVQGHKGWF